MYKDSVYCDHMMSSVSVLTLAAALDDARGCTKLHLLLGNGFSIACRPNIFVYKRLFEQADFTALSPSVRGAFAALGTQDFERVIKALRDAAALLAAYPHIPSGLAVQLAADADALRELLVRTIASSHPERPSDITEEEYAACKAFLAPFDTTYTLNYDLLLYWAFMHNDEGTDPVSDDGFRTPDGDADAAYVTWEPSNTYKQTLWFLHGALHLFDAGSEIQKYTWINTGVRLIEQVRGALQRNAFPVFVAEGTSDEKYTRIRHSDYLSKAYRSFSEITGALFIFGHSLAENDEHYLKRIEKGKLSHVYFGLHGDAGTPANQAIIARALRLNSLGRKRALAVAFFDTASANVWGHAV